MDKRLSFIGKNKSISIAFNHKFNLVNLADDKCVSFIFSFFTKMFAEIVERWKEAR